MKRVKKCLFILVGMLFIIVAGGCAVSVTTTQITNNNEKDRRLSGNRRDFATYGGG